MAKKKKDQLSVIGFVSALLKNRSQQRSMAKARDKHGAASHSTGNAPKEKKPKDTRTPDQIRIDVDIIRTRLGTTVESIRYDLDVPARARDLRDHIKRQVPADWKGEPQAAIVALSLLATGLGGIVLGTIVKVNRDRA